MKKDVTTFTRYFFMLIIVFIAWLFLLHNFVNQPNVTSVFQAENSSL